MNCKVPYFIVVVVVFLYACIKSHSDRPAAAHVRVGYADRRPQLAARAHHREADVPLGLVERGVDDVGLVTGRLVVELPRLAEVQIQPVLSLRITNWVKEP